MGLDLGALPARVDRVQVVRRKTELSEPRRENEDGGRKGRSVFVPKATINVSGCGVVRCVHSMWAYVSSCLLGRPSW